MIESYFLLNIISFYKGLLHDKTNTHTFYGVTLEKAGVSGMLGSSDSVIGGVFSPGLSI